MIPCLLVRDKGLVKTVKFGKSKYVGDPINAVRIFNEKQVDELIVLDIDASSTRRDPNEKMIGDLAAECRMPLCYGGGIKTADQAQGIIGLGVEKVSLSSAAMESPNLVTEIASCIGSQSIVVVLDIKKRFLSGRYEIWTHNGKRNTKKCPIEMVRQFEQLGAGEIVINSIDHDGEMKGYDLDLVEELRESISIPMTVLGGAGSLDDIGQLINRFGTIGAAAGSLFVFKGPYKAVLINYPSYCEKNALIENNLACGGLDVHR